MGWALMCAQRLSASKIGSHHVGGIGLQFCGVLNACRRQRSVHPCCQQRSAWPSPGAQRLSASKIGSLLHMSSQGARRQVLNACRRQRSVHATYRTRGSGCNSCSTPVGVKDRFTWPCRTSLAMSSKCSTPVGVKDRFTGGRRINWSECTSAHRLSASQIGSLHQVDTDGGIISGAQRLSASKIGSHSRGVRCGEHRWRAQRLSASKIGSQGSTVSTSLTLVLCSTPVGVKDRFTR